MPAEPQRTEIDQLGPIQVPAQALYGARTARALATTCFSVRCLGDARELVRGFAAVKAAAARANATAGVFDTRIGDAIEAAAAQLDDDSVRSHLVADPLAGGGSIALHGNVNEVIANLANESLGGRRGTYAPIDPFRHVGASQSTADVCHTAIRLALLEAARPALRSIDAVVDELDTFAQRTAHLPTLARTCLRDGMATTVDVLFRGHAQAMRRRRASLESSLHPLYAVALGGTVIGDGSGAPAAYRAVVVDALASVTGLRLSPRPDRHDALQNSDDLGEVSGQLAHLARASMKLANDLRLLGSGPRGGFGELLLPVVQEGSSFFAGKSNPVVPETVLLAAHQILGRDAAARESVRAAELHLNVFDLAAGLDVIEALHLASGSLERLATHCLHELAVDVDRCAALSKLVQPLRRDSR